LKKGAKIGCCFSNALKFYIVDLACIIAECTSVAISPNHHSVSLLDSCDLILNDQSNLELISMNSFDSQIENDIYTIFFSSGSTGTPKVINLKFEFMNFSAQELKKLGKS
jgi:long-subunit acyl-CoA synthetase (AMP-forming)